MSMPLSPGAVVAGKYTIVAEIGAGASGTVYRARSVSSRDVFALKVMHADAAQRATDPESFAREASTLMSLQHPHIVRLLDYGHTADGVPFLAFNLLEGRTLDKRLRDEGALDWGEVGWLSLQVLKALERAHGRGFVHRDIKPGNIFLQRTAAGEVVRVLDFGLAKLAAGAAPATLHSGLVEGTPRYMAPEQARGEEVGACADIYSFGLVLGEMLCGTPLVSGASDMEIYVAQGSDEPLTLPEQVLSSPYAGVVLRAVAKPLEQRYRLASQMLADVQAVHDRLDEGEVDPDDPELDATQLLDLNSPLRLSLQSPTSQKLRDAFNVLAKKSATEKAFPGAPSERPPVSHPPPAAAPSAAEPGAVPEPPPVLPVAAPTPPPLVLPVAPEALPPAPAPTVEATRALAPQRGASPVPSRALQVAVGTVIVLTLLTGALGIYLATAPP
ncbi:MAG: serine/threonine protein kinase [Polyangiaceae bacterium]|nr:serine/threonine protein kinase [Polyangiaceae bacterium]